ncbi:MAG: hypothetical protein GX099_01125 [Clostridiaceae bacterium]|nr:hypothetical protein [Clostridiaceae bacterium]
MKKYITIYVFLLLPVFLLSSCMSLFLPKEPEPFQTGILAGPIYLNFQANLKFSVPIGWTAYAGAEAQAETQKVVDSEIGNIKGLSFSELDFVCVNYNTGSNVLIGYDLIPRNDDFDKIIDKTIENLKKQATDTGIVITIIDSFDQTIAGRDYRVEVAESTMRGITIHTYMCFAKIDSYACMIFVVPNDCVDPNETFDNIIANISEAA